MQEHTHNPIRELAHDAATDAVPVQVEANRTDFGLWCEAVDYVRGGVEAAIRTEVHE